MSETIATTTTTAREGIQTLGTVGWDGCEDMPEAYGHACAELTAEALTEAASGAIDKLSESVANMNPEDLAAGADLIKEAVSNVVQKKAE